jgi:hypothetical protein
MDFIESVIFPLGILVLTLFIFSKKITDYALKSKINKHFK